MKNNLLQYVQECADEQANVVILEGQVQSAIDEAREAEVIVDQTDEDLRSANAAIDSLYRLAGAIEEGVSNDGPANQTLAAVTEVALEGIYSSIGMQKPRTLSLEADFLDNLKNGAEKIKEHAVRILAAIIEAFRKAVDWIADYVKKATSASAAIGKYAEKLRAEARKTKNANVAAHIQDKNLAKALSGEGTLASRYKNVTELVKDARDTALGGHVHLLNEIIDDYADSEAKDIDAVLKVALGLIDVLGKTYSGVFEHEDELLDVADAYKKPGTDIYTTDFMPGGYLGILVMPKGLDSLRHLNFLIRRDDDEAEKQAGDGKLATLTLKEIDELLGAVIETTRVITNFQMHENRLREISGKLTKAVDKLKKTPKEMNQQHRELLGVIAIMAPYIAKGIHSRVFGFATGCSKAVVSYCEKSLEMHGANTEKK